MDDNSKQKIRPKIVIEEGDKIPSIDSMSSEPEMISSVESNTETVSALPEEQVKIEDNFEEVTPVLEQPKTTILQEETKDNPTNDVKIVEPPQLIEKKKSGKLTAFLITIVVALIIALLAGGVYVYMNGTKTDSTNSDTDATLLSPTPPNSTDNDTPPATSPTPEQKVDVSTLKVNILNGSGKIGEAGKAKSALEKAGFKVANTGNAATFDFEETVIQTKEGTAQSVIDLLKETLSETYEVEIGDSLKTTSTYDIVITVGSK